MQKHYLNKLRAILIFNCFLFNSILSTPQEVVADFTAQLIKKEQGPVVVFIYADYCGACKKAKEELPEIIKSCGKNISFYQSNTQDHFGMGFLNSHNILEQEVNSIPLFVIRKNGKITYSQVGYPGKEKLIQMIKKYS